jgi:acetoin utilization deacetylase AcuC-like enzyme
MAANTTDRANLSEQLLDQLANSAGALITRAAAAHRQAAEAIVSHLAVVSWPGHHHAHASPDGV